MNLHDIEIPLGRLVAEHPHLIRTLEGLGLDYCCGGHRPLSQAVAEKGLDLEEVLAALKQALASTQDACAAPWLEKTCSELIDHIVRSHHGFLRTELPRLSTLTDKVFEVHGSGTPELGELRRVMAGFREEIESHLAKEEQILFPAIVACEARGAAMPQGAGVLARGPISCMESEHDEAGAALAEMRRLTGDYSPPEAACGSWRALYLGLEELEQDMHRHIHEENNILFEQVRAAGW